MAGVIMGGLVGLLRFPERLGILAAACGVKEITGWADTVNAIPVRYPK